MENTTSIGLQGFNIYVINHWLLIAIVPILVLLSFLEKRKSHQDICQGRPALIIPFSFLDGFDNRTAYAMAFGTITSTIVSLITSENTLGFDLPLWGKALYVYLQAFIGCLTCFPLFACLSTRYRALGTIICIFYSALWLSLNMVQTIKNVQESANNTLWFGTSQDPVLLNLAKASAVLQGLPSICCYVVLIGYCIFILQRCIRSGVYMNKHVPGTVKPHQEEHVRWVFRKSKDKTLNPGGFMSNKTFVELMHQDRKLKLLKSLPFFKYPTRIFAVAFVQLNIIYWMGMLLISGTIQALYSIFLSVMKKSEITSADREQIAIVCICASVSLLVSISNSLVHILLATRNYRYHMLKIYQGDKSFLPSATAASSQYVLTSSMIYPGYQIAFMMWGLVLSFGFILLISLLVAEPLYLLASFDMLGKAFRKLGELLSFPATMLLLFYIQVFVSKKLLLQDKVTPLDKYPPLNVNNRKLYELVNYYSIFTNMAVGLFTCLFRIALSAFFGIFSVDRLDKSVFTRDMEKFDNGYRAYLSMLLVDNAHNNPSMRVFAHLLWTRTLAARFRNSQSEPGYRDETPLSPPSPRLDHRSYGAAALASRGGPTIVEGFDNSWTHCDINNCAVSKPARIRWFLAYTLIRNPQLGRFRKQCLALSEDSSLINLANNDSVEHSEIISFS
ncbi:unnamed protein product [Lymnaea stagnalis]|uniref:Receptor for retinol uptake STRA6 n=1 Tax=Lymnaea stagnalis TaxID=6523 RepID=A0AAV2H5Y5_LYMST